MKKSIDVTAIFAEDFTFPLSVGWRGGCMWDVQRIISSDGCSHFTCLVNGVPRKLLYEAEHWFELL